MALHLNNAAGERNLVIIADLKPLFVQVRRGKIAENQLLSTNTYYLEYFAMRKCKVIF